MSIIKCFFLMKASLIYQDVTLSYNIKVVVVERVVDKTSLKFRVWKKCYHCVYPQTTGKRYLLATWLQFLWKLVSRFCTVQHFVMISMERMQPEPCQELCCWEAQTQGPCMMGQTNRNSCSLLASQRTGI